MPDGNPDPRLVAYAQNLFRQGKSSELVSGRLATRYPGLSAAEVDFITGRARLLVNRAFAASNARRAATLEELFPEFAVDNGTVHIDALVAFIRQGSDPAYRTLRFSVPWTITIEDYENNVIALAMAWAQGGGPNNPTLGGGTRPDIIDPFHRIFPDSP